MPNTVAGRVKFIQWQELYEYEKPFQIFIDPPKGAKDQRTTNLIYEDRTINVVDIRGEESTYSLDDHGFTYRHHESTFDDFEKRDAVETEYLPEMERVLKSEVDGVDKVYFFDWRVNCTISARLLHY
jgi:hypothetical protein